MVLDGGVPADIVREYLRFRCLNQELICSVCILDLDLTLIKRDEPILWERHQDHVTEAGTWAYLSIERADAQGGVTLEPLYLESALRQFARDWTVAKEL
ncbi:hypothetical protein [Actinocrispum sp. NPDC049592]|uniref:hypothetical protein n=1 Tax=Actinocrispum sp. NPDC049592 TaxID=3154835 RepID=UPI0034271D86